jgi:serine/threonine protein kinase
MGTSRIADANVIEPTRPPAVTARLATRMGAMVASPLGVLIIVPALVASVGGFLAATSERALRRSNVEAAEARLVEETELVAGAVRDALGQAEPMLDRLAVATAAHGPADDFEPYAHVLADLMVGRPGVAFVSASFTDGTFQGAYIDDDGVTRFQDSRISVTGTHVRRYDYDDGGALSLRREETNAYDPRTRGFYRLAVARRGRVFTEPYTFFGTMHTGVTRTMPVYVGEGTDRALHAVLTVDFDVAAMSEVLSVRGLPGTRALLYAEDGTLLAYSHTEALRDRPRRDRVLRYTDLDDPVLRAFFASGAPRRGGVSRAVAGDETYIVATARASEAALGWRIAFAAPESRVLAPLRVYERRSAIAFGSAVFVAVLIAIIFARHITRTRREADAARAEAAEARKIARDLGSYRLVSMLGKGGMGEVWRAEHRLLSRAAAIKLVNPDVTEAQRTELLARFKREAQALAALRSRNTIEIYDYGVTENDTFFYVMELLDGFDLETLVNDYGPQPAQRVVSILVQICSSLAEAHDAGMVHRDIKPANVFLCRAADEVDIVKVLDFGLVRSGGVEIERGALGETELEEALGRDSAKITRANGLLGTPAFMPKEQALGLGVDGRSDLYAVGGVAYFLLTGRLVFEHANPMNMLFMHVQAELPNIRHSLPASVPDAMVDIVRACLSKDPDGRPRTARALAEALRAIPFAEGSEGAFAEADARRFWAVHEARGPTRKDTSDVASAPTLVSLPH